ncbi:ArsR family transcriptional regulator [Agrobacterium cavarae]
MTIGNSHRLLILKLLLEQEVSVGQLGHTVGLNQSALSQHLAKSRDKDLYQSSMKPTLGIPKCCRI